MSDPVTFDIKRCTICGMMMSSYRNTCCLSCGKEHIKRKYKK